MTKNKLFLLVCGVLFVIFVIISPFITGPRGPEIAGFVFLIFLWIAKKVILENPHSKDDPFPDGSNRRKLDETTKGMDEKSREIKNLRMHRSFLESTQAEHELPGDERRQLLEAVKKELDSCCAQYAHYERQEKDLRDKLNMK